MRLGPGRIDRQDGQVFGRGRRIGEPLGQRSRAVVLVSIQRDHGQRVPSRLASVRLEPAHVDGGAEGMARPTVRKPGLPGGCASRRPPAEPAHRPLHDGSQVGGETGAPRRVEPLDGHRQGEGAGLDPILERHVPRRDPARERHDEALQGLHQRVPARSQRSPAARAVARPGPSTTRSSCRMSHVARSGRRRSRRRAPPSVTRARRGSRGHPIRSCQARRRAESSGSRRSDQEAPADGRRDLPAVDPRIPVLEARVLDARDACGRLHQRRARLGQLGDQRGFGRRVEPAAKARPVRSRERLSFARRSRREPRASEHRKARRG